jgi:hypothetical protein
MTGIASAVTGEQYDAYNHAILSGARSTGGEDRRRVCRPQARSSWPGERALQNPQQQPPSDGERTLVASSRSRVRNNTGPS